MLGVFEVEFDAGVGEAACGAYVDAGVRVVSGQPPWRVRR